MREVSIHESYRKEDEELTSQKTKHSEECRVVNIAYKLVHQNRGEQQNPDG